MTASWAGRIITLKFTGAITLNNGASLFLAWGTFTANYGSTLTLICEGADWNEIARRV